MKRKVLQLIGSFHQGGSELQAIQLARLLHDSGRYELHVACLDPTGVLRDEIERLEIAEIPEFRLTSFYNRNAVTQLLRFARLLREREIDIIQTHDFYSNVFGMAAGRLARVPARIAARRETSGWRTPAQKTVERAAYRLAHAVVANAEAVRNQLIKEGVRRDKIAVVYNGLNPERITPNPALDRQQKLASLGLPQIQDRRFITIVANLRHPVKDHSTFLRAARRVREVVPQACFVIAGEGPLIDETRAFARQLGIEENLFFLGHCEQVAELLSISDVCVLSSKAEGFSNAILEYMAASRPAVVTDVGGAREAVVEGESGYLVQAGDDQLMGAHIITLLVDPQKADSMGRRAREIVDEKFSLQAQLERTERLYDRLLDSASHSLQESINTVHQEGV
ncbi:MAG TPA: glycosyltransferase [Blastocatellia bacterium]|nr:glycosyltransferase [Blastocatellia bacterium]